jgi:hypothetical protein
LPCRCQPRRLIGADLSAALDAVKNHRLAFRDAMLRGAAQQAGVRHLLTEDIPGCLGFGYGLNDDLRLFDEVVEPALATGHGSRL